MREPTLLLTLTIVSITLALIFYTFGVWSERRQGILKKSHVILFGIGLTFDTGGTSLMSVITRLKGIGNPQTFAIHQATGILAILLMLFHFIWAIIVLNKGSEQAKANFHRFSIVVWSFWLIPYFAGALMGMTH